MPFPAAPFLSAVSFSSALFLSLLALPRLGVFVAMFAGVPIIMAQLRYPAVLLGTGAMVTSGGVIFLFASLLKTTMPGLAVLLYIGLCGLPALVVASLIRRGSPPLMIILSGAFQIVFFWGESPSFFMKNERGAVDRSFQIPSSSRFDCDEYRNPECPDDTDSG